MQVRVGLGVHPCLLVAVLTGCVSAGCMPLGQETTGSGTAPPDAGPPAPCSASPSSPPFCTTSDGGACPLLSDETISCPSGAVSPASNGTTSIGIATGPGGGGEVVFGTQSGPTPEALEEYVEVGLFDATGASSFAVDTFPPLPLANTGAGGLAGLDVVTTPQGTPVLLSTVGGGLTAAIGSAAAGGGWSLENAVAAPTDGRGFVLGGAGVEAGGAIDVLLQGATSSNVARRDPGGAWTTSPVPYTIDSAAIAVDATGKVYTAGWVEASGGTAQLEVAVGSGAPVVLTTGPATDVGQVEITVGRNADGSPLPVVAYGSTLTLAVPDGKGGFTKVQPTLTVAQPYADTCGDANGLSLGNCTCVPTCGQTGDSVNDVELVRDAQGDVYIAWLEVDTNYTYPVDKSTTSVVGQTVTCDCTPDLSNGSGEVSAVGLELERLVMTPSPHTEHRGAIPVPPHIGSVLPADGDGTLQLLISSDETSGTIALRRVVFDAGKLP